MNIQVPAGTHTKKRGGAAAAILILKLIFHWVNFFRKADADWFAAVHPTLPLILKRCGEKKATGLTAPVVSLTC
jgi:hypothetical protein